MGGIKLNYVEDFGAALSRRKASAGSGGKFLPCTTPPSLLHRVFVVSARSGNGAKIRLSLIRALP